MTYQRHWLLSWGGTLGFGKDVWANNVRMMNKQAGSQDSLGSGTMEAMLDDFVKDIRAFMRDTRTAITGAVQCQWVKFNEIGPDGRYVDQTNTHVRYLAGTTGDFAVINGPSTANVPSYQSVCVTTTTDAARGPASKGRLFLPQCGPTLLQTGEIDPTAAANIAASAASFFTALGNEAGVDLQAIAPFVVSNVGNPGPVRRITGVKVGNVPDVISRRKNAYTEVYSKATVTTG